LLDQARIKMHLGKRLGLPVDIITQSQNNTPTPFQTDCKIAIGSETRDFEKDFLAIIQKERPVK